MLIDNQYTIFQGKIKGLNLKCLINIIIQKFVFNWKSRNITPYQYVLVFKFEKWLHTVKLALLSDFS